ncbi:MAG: ABC transporter ATP-binding protein [Candidatus Obscuribacterales bacterium]|jgi:putative ABC transport system ATP-binding protein/macrolide transport system ATP-binding/permease protein/lipoprotein-releasing system ATP-binding protein
MPLSVSNLSKSYTAAASVKAVRDVSFEVEDGSFLAIVGNSGSGKSTLLAMVGGISRPTTGKVEFGGNNLWAQSDNFRADFRNSTIGFVFQFASLLPTLKAIDNVALPALVSGAFSEKAAYARARVLLEQVQLADRIDSFPGELSGGEQRRVAIARSLINSPKILLADEPTADLDQETESEILALLLEIHRAHKLTMILVTHNKDIAAMADKVLTMKAGAAELGQASERVPSPYLASTARVDSIYDISAQAVAREQVRLGVGFERYVGRFVLILLPLLALIYVINLGVASWQQSVIATQLDKQQALEDLAMSDLKAGVKDIRMAASGTYELDLFLRNSKGDKPMFVMVPVTRVFVQVGNSWQETAIEPLDKPTSSVVQITGERIFHYRLKPNVSGYTQLIPYYMHVRITNDLLVSPSSLPKDDLVERNDSYYVYLKPHGINNSLIESKMKFAGEPPVYMPMPPH